MTTYLLLTCFDILGQPEDWVTFTDWLCSSRKKSERDTVVLSQQPNPDAVAVTTAMHEKYTELYAVRRAFVRFIEDVLSPADRAALLESLRIEQVQTPRVNSYSPDRSELPISAPDGIFADHGYAVWHSQRCP